MGWNLTADRPVFVQITEILSQNIITGVYKPGDKLPSVRDLAAEAAVNPNTMQRALAELERSGLVYAQRTAGRFITEDQTLIDNLRKELAMSTIKEFLDKMESLGYDINQTIELLHDVTKEDDK